MLAVPPPVFSKSKVPSTDYRKFLIIGHPGSGTKYMTKLFQTYDLNVGHEAIGPNGICSWMSSHYAPVGHLIDVYAFAMPRRFEDKFDVVIHLVRNPWDSIGNILIENANEKSFKFRRNIIMYHFFIDLNKYNQMDRAALSYIYWNRLTEAQGPDYRIRIEDADDEVPKLLKVAKKQILGISKTINSKHSKVTNFDEMTPDVKALLERTAKRYGY